MLGSFLVLQDVRFIIVMIVMKINVGYVAMDSSSTPWETANVSTNCIRVSSIPYIRELNVYKGGE